MSEGEKGGNPRKDRIYNKKSAVLHKKR